MFFWSMRPSECMLWILLSCNFGDLYASGMQDAEVNKVTAYFFGMDKKLLDNYVLEFNHAKKIPGVIYSLWLSLLQKLLYIADWFAIGHLGIPNNAMISLRDHQTIAYHCLIPNAQSNLYRTSCTSVQCIRSWLLTCNKLDVKISYSWRNSQAEINHFRLNWVNIIS